MKKDIFRVGDTVFDVLHGKGEVIKIDKDPLYPIKVDFGKNKDIQAYTLDGKILSDSDNPTLSLTPYTLIKGGFSQDRPLRKGTPVFVRKSRICEWQVRIFSHFDNENEEIRCFNDAYLRGETSGWSVYSLTNPLEKTYYD